MGYIKEEFAAFGRKLTTELEKLTKEFREMKTENQDLKSEVSALKNLVGNSSLINTDKVVTLSKLVHKNKISYIRTARQGEDLPANCHQDPTICKQYEHFLDFEEKIKISADLQEDLVS